MSQAQLPLFHPADASGNEPEAIKAQRAVNLNLLESAGWKESGWCVCMIEGCYTPLEIWKRKRKGKRAEVQFLERDTLMPHEVSPEHRHEEKS